MAAWAGSRAVARQVWFVFATGYAGLWLLILSGILGPIDSMLGDLAQLSMFVIGAVVLGHNASSPRPVLGRGTRILALGLAIFAMTEAVWTALDFASQPRSGWLDVSYASSSALMAAGAFTASRPQVWPQSRARRGRTIVDIVLLVASALLFWRSIIAVVNPNLDTFDRSVVTMGVADSAFVVVALMAWVRAEPGRRRTLRLVSLAALLIYASDLWYACVIPVGGAEFDIKWLDAGWALAAALLTKCVVPSGASRWQRIPGVSRWIGACLPPLAGLAVVMILAFDGVTRTMLPGLGYASLCLAVLIVIRQVFFAAEQFELIDRVEAASRQQAHRADHDDLTGVLARRAFLSKAKQVIKTRRANPGGHIGLLWIDVDDFKRVNDTFGHAAGDRVLQTVARRLKRAARTGDIVGRLGGDEFVVLRPDLSTSAVAWAERMSQAVASPIDVGGATVRVACSAGVVRSDGSDELDDLVVDGDLALLDAKRTGRSRVVEFTSTHTDLLSETRALADYVRATLQRGEVKVRYQPVVQFSTNTVVGAEALARLAGRDGVELKPADFLQLVELQGLLPRLFELVLDQALRDFAGLQLRISINATTSDVTAPGFVARVSEALRRHDVDARRLILELNERVTPQRRVVEAVQELGAIGVRVALDDFGTQWSRIDQVQSLRPSLVKLDRELVTASSGSQQPGTGMLVGTLALAKSFGAKVIAEGIETPAHAEAAISAGADLGQGWFWAHDLPINELLTQLPQIGREQRRLRQSL